jgi:Rab family protein
MAKVIQQTTKKMSQLCRKIVQVDVRWGMIQRVSFVGQFFRFIWNKLMVCSVGRSQYKRLSLNVSSSSSSSPPSPAAVDDGFRQEQHQLNNGYESDSDLVNLKISLLGDCDIGKTTFLVSKFLSLGFFGW